MSEVGQAEGGPVALTGLHTFLIADVRGYTGFTLEHGDEAAAKLASQFAVTAREVVTGRGGQVIELRGDEALAVFASARQALRAAVEMQGRFREQSMGESNLPFKVGIGLDAGEAIAVEGGYRGAALNLAARLCSLAGPQEVLASEGVVHLARKMDGVEYAERGAVQLKGFSDPVRVVQVLVETPEDAGKHGDLGKNLERSLPIGGFLGALPAGPLVARGDELGKIAASIDAVAGGTGQLVLLAGEPGVGKTRLAQEVTLRLRNRGFLVAGGRCYEPQEGVPFYPFLEALGILYEMAPPGIRREVGHRWPYLARLLPNENLPVPVGTEQGKEEQERLFWSVAGFVRTSADRVPVALLLDDLHWADTSSLLLLQHLARHTRAARVLLLGTYRDVEVRPQHPLERALRDLNREQLTERIAIHRLPENGTAALVATAFGEEKISEEFADLVHRHTQGNPFFTQEVLRALVERGDIYRENSHWERHEIDHIEVPESVRSTIGERLSRLSERTQEMLHEASVLGQTFAFDDLRGVADRGEDELEEALEEARRAGLVSERGKEWYAFNHALTQQALYAALSSRRKRRLHLAVGEVLEKLPQEEGRRRAAELARHLLEADEPGRALPYCVAAGDTANEVYAYPEAEQHYRMALELAKDVALDDPRRASLEADIRQKLGDVLRSLARFDASIACLEVAAETCRARGEWENEAGLIVKVGWVNFDRGTHREGIARLKAFLDSSGPQEPTSVLCELHDALSLLFFGCGQYREAVEAGGQALEIARVIGEDRLLVRTLVRHNIHLHTIGWLRGDASVVDEVIPRLEALEAVGDFSVSFLAYVHLSELYQYAGEFGRAIDYRERCLAMTEGRGHPPSISFALANLVETLILKGEWQQAHEYLERALDITRSLGSSWWSPYPLLHLGRLYTLEGKWEEAAGPLNECISLGAPQDDLQVLRQSNQALAEIELRRGDSEGALSRLRPLLDRPGLEELNVTSLLPLQAEAQLQMGDVAQAEGMVGEAVRRAREQSRPDLTEALRVQGMVLTRQEGWEEAEDAFEEGRSLARVMPYPYSEARILHERGIMSARKGEEHQARERLTQALKMFQRLGAQKDIERTERALETL